MEKPLNGHCFLVVSWRMESFIDVISFISSAHSGVNEPEIFRAWRCMEYHVFGGPVLDSVESSHACGLAALGFMSGPLQKKLGVTVST